MSKTGQIRASGSRVAKQERSQQTRAKIASGAIEVLARHGIAGLSHRRVAESAGVSLAATTYYFDSKFDIVAEASRVILDGYAKAFQRVLDRGRQSTPVAGAFSTLGARLICNAARRDRLGAISWAEIILDSVRHEESRALARDWFVEMSALWLRIAKAFRISNPGLVSRSAIDVIIGLIFMVIALGLTEREVAQVLDDGGDPLMVWRRKSPKPVKSGAAIGGATTKALATRKRLLSAAMDTLISDGAAAVTYRVVASKAELTPAAPLYHFPTIDGLLAAAQVALFEDSKGRYRAVMSGVDYKALGVEELADLTTTVFLREATEFGARNVAQYSIWLQAARQPSLRGMVWASIEDQGLAWRRLLSLLLPSQRPIDALLVQALFIGKLIRVLATGSTTTDLARVRTEFAGDIYAMAKGRFWWKNGTDGQKT